jgi:DNA-directed RNA polymerase subunit F
MKALYWIVWFVWIVVVASIPFLSTKYNENQRRRRRWMLNEGKRKQQGIIEHIMQIFKKHGENRRTISSLVGIMPSPQEEVQLLFGSVTDIRVILFQGKVTIHPCLLAGDHDEAWKEIVEKYLNQIVLPENTKEVFLT